VVTDVVAVIEEGHPAGARPFKSAAGVIGVAVPDIVSLLNPRAVILGGPLAAVDDVLFAVAHEAVYRRRLAISRPSRALSAIRPERPCEVATDRVYDGHGPARLLGGRDRP
jgi:predicted NBD/HSP70 family sugar kinase